MKKNRSLAVVTEDNLITKIIKSLKNFLRFKQEKGDKEDNLNRRATVIKAEKIVDRKIKRNITYADLAQMEDSISKNIKVIDNLDEEELNMLDEYYDARINELNATLNDKKSNYFKMSEIHERNEKIWKNEKI